MGAAKNKSSDLLGIAPYGEAVKIAVEKSFEGASALLSKICLPAAEEFGLMLKDKMRYWRVNNIIKIVEKSQGKIGINATDLQLTVHPRIVHEVMDSGSWCDDNTLQDMWAGLLTSSCEICTTSDSNLLFVNSLKQLTSIQAKVINHICSKCCVVVHLNQFLTATSLTLTFNELSLITGSDNLLQLDAELDNLRANEFIGNSLFGSGGGFSMSDNPITANLRPSAFLLQLYAKSQGFKGDIKEFYKNQIIEFDATDNDGKILIV
jgi:hypothetical protein